MNAGIPDLPALLKALPGLDQGELLALAAAYAAQDADKRNAAWSTVRSVANALTLTSELDHLARDIVRWADSRGARSGVYTFASPADALLLGDALDLTSRRILLAPWRHTMTRPTD